MIISILNPKSCAKWKELTRDGFETCQIGDDEKLFQSQSQGNDRLSQCGEVVLATVRGFSYHAVYPLIASELESGGWAFVGEQDSGLESVH